MEVLRILYILNAMNSCELDDRERRYTNTHCPRFQSRGFCRDDEIFDGILNWNNQIHKILFHTYQ